MKIPILIITLLVIVGGFVYFNNTPKTTGMTETQAVDNVKKLPEVQDYLKRVPNALVEVDNESEGQYNVHVYEIKDGHTATFNWYRVDKATGEVKKEF